MVALQISRNESTLYTAGMANSGKLLTTVSYSRLIPDEIISTYVDEVNSLEIQTFAMEIDNEGMVHWPTFNLKLGDELRIRIVDSGETDPPAFVHPPDDPAKMLKQRKETVRRLVRELGWQVIESEQE